MMTERQGEFRKEYRSRIAERYNGYVHVLMIYAVGLTALWIYAQHITQVRWWEWLTVPVVALLSNVFEWYLHKYIMHRPINVTGLRSFYNRHTLNHHLFFTDNEMRFRDHRDWRVTLFPPDGVVMFILMSLPFVAILYLVSTANIAWLSIATTTSVYLIYEFMHFCCHLDEGRFVRYCPLVNTMRRNHTAHHNARLMMELNMNLTFPFADWLFGTSDLDRGLLGHLFNGYGTRHLKSGLKARPLLPDEAAAAPIPAE